MISIHHGQAIVTRFLIRIRYSKRFQVCWSGHLQYIAYFAITNERLKVLSPHQVHSATKLSNVTCRPLKKLTMSDSPYYAGVPIWIPYPDGTGYAAGTVDKVDSTNSTHTSDPEERLGVHLVLDDPTILPSLSSSSKESQNPDIFTWYFPVAILTGAGNSSKLQPSSISPTLGGSNTAWGGLPLVGKDVDGKPVPLPPLREPHRDVLEDLAELTALNEANGEFNVACSLSSEDCRA